MKSKLIIVLILIMILVAGCKTTDSKKKDDVKSKEPSTNKEEGKPSSSNLKAACDIYTLDIAKKYLGATAKKGDTASSDSEIEGPETIISTCLYENADEISKIINIQLIAAKTAAGKSWNKNTFETAPNEVAKISGGKPPALKQISGIGDKAYWNPSMGQLVVLIDDSKYFLSIQGSLRDKEPEIKKHEEMAKDLISNL